MIFIQELLGYFHGGWVGFVPQAIHQVFLITYHYFNNYKFNVKFSWNVRRCRWKNDDFECTRRTQQMNTKSKNTVISIFNTNKTDKWSQKSTPNFVRPNFTRGPKKIINTSFFIQISKLSFLIMLGPLCIFILARYDRELNTCSVFSLVGDWSEWSESVWMIRLGWLYSYGYWLNSGWLNTGWLNTGYWLNCDIWLIRCCCSTILYWNIYCCICNRCSFSFSTYSLGYNIPLCFLDFD